MIVPKGYSRNASYAWHSISTFPFKQHNYTGTTMFTF